MGKAVSGTDENGFMTKGTVAALAEAMDSEKYGYKYLMDSSLNIIELEQDQGLFMGQDFPIFGPMVRARICWKQLPGGVMYHYEIAVGLNEHAGYSSLQDADIRCTDHECRILVPATADAG